MSGFKYLINKNQTVYRNKSYTNVRRTSSVLVACGGSEVLPKITTTVYMLIKRRIYLRKLIELKKSVFL
jgi:spore coat polysaccharide biosynthesis predicted glycosyltransferase SpsG